MENLLLFCSLLKVFTVVLPTCFIQRYAKLNLLLYIPCKESAFLGAFLFIAGILYRQ